MRGLASVLAGKHTHNVHHRKSVTHNYDRAWRAEMLEAIGKVQTSLVTGSEKRHSSPKHTSQDR